jgi:thiol:disulfide interchange protein DsbD
MARIKIWLFASVLCTGLADHAAARPWWLRGVDTNETDFLPPDVAFRVTAGVDGDRVRVRWVIADGYYLYRERMRIQAESPDLVVGAAILPEGTLKQDPYLGTQRIYTGQIIATAPFTRSDAGAHPMQVKVTYQGCAEAGLCYPPITKVLYTDQAPQTVASPTHPWEGVAILGGVLAFFGAGLLLRQGRALDRPA